MLFPWLVWYPLVLKPFSLFFSAPARLASEEKSGLSCLGIHLPWRERKQDSQARRHSLAEQPEAATNSFSRITSHESRITAFFRITAFMLFTNHSFPTHDFPPFPTISRHFPAPPPPPPIKCPRVHAPSAFLGQPPGLPRRAAPPGHCFPARCGEAWGGYGAAWAAAVPRTGNTAFPVHQTSEISSGANQSSAHGFHESRDTNHESRITAFLSRASTVGW